jgi:hypothetical protein
LRTLHVLAFLVLATSWASAGYAQPKCDAPALTDQQVKDIVDKERLTRTDLPARFNQVKWVVRRQGCHYIYTEFGVPEALDLQHAFTLNQRGVIVDVQIGTSDTSPLRCPEHVFAESELAEIVKNERAKRRDLPARFANTRTDVQRLRCLYLYYEYAVPERRGDYQVFTIDPLGEVLDFSRSKPY